MGILVGGDDTSGVVMVRLTEVVGATETEVITPLAIQDRKMPNMKCHHVIRRIKIVSSYQMKVMKVQLKYIPDGTVEDTFLVVTVPVK